MCGGAAAERTAGGREDVRMTTDELGGDGLDGVGEIESAVLGGQLRVKHALEQHVAEFALQRVEIATVERVERFVRLLEQERPQRSERLLPVPRASLRGSQGRHRVDQRLHRARRAGGAVRRPHGGAAAAVVYGRDVRVRKKWTWRSSLSPEIIEGRDRRVDAERPCGTVPDPCV